MAGIGKPSDDTANQQEALTIQSMSGVEQAISASPDLMNAQVRAEIMMDEAIKAREEVKRILAGTTTPANQPAETTTSTPTELPPNTQATNTPPLAA